jgi:hypothetical protein
MDPNSVSENNASAPIAPPEYRPTQSTSPKRTGIKLLIIVIVSGVALAAIGYILMGVLGAFMIGNFLNIATHKPTANETAAACRILTSAIYDIEQALEKEKFTERGVSYKCEGATFGFNHNKGIISYWSREANDRKRAEIQDCTNIIDSLPVFQSQETKNDISAMCHTAETIDGRIAVRIDIYASPRSDNLPPERTITQKPDPTDLSQYDLSQKYTFTYYPAGTTLDTTKRWILYRDNDGEKVFATLAVYSNAIAVSPKRFGGLKCADHTTDTKCTHVGSARGGKHLYAVKGLDADTYYTLREASIDFVVVVTHDSLQNVTTDEISKIFDGIAPNATP